ncbi:hypothetical protein [Paraburkholderia hospita]|uniref:hypothetical protein n=1 Tax=Paraburkholderia hospita TaxID=169430 RepID=UPI000B344FA0|nr:hypothetical protein [Paraburkholderia hospita]OUL97895.1 hypothetical protein CA603_00150 [Paraburkholderia hospita]
MIKACATAVAFIFVAGCASEPIPATTAKEAPTSRLLAFQEKSAPNDGKLVVTRDIGFGGSGCFYAVAINGTLAARLDVGETSRFSISPGEVLLRVGRDPQGKGLCAFGKSEWTQRETVLRPGETKFFRLSIDVNGKTDIERGDM